MRRHLAAAGEWVVGGARLQRLDTASCPGVGRTARYAIVGMQPIVARPRYHTRGRRPPAHVKKIFSCRLNRNLAVVELAPKRYSQAVDVDQLLAREPFIFFRLRDRFLGCALVVAIRYLKGVKYGARVRLKSYFYCKC